MKPGKPELLRITRFVQPGIIRPITVYATSTLQCNKSPGLWHGPEAINPNEIGNMLHIVPIVIDNNASSPAPSLKDVHPGKEKHNKCRNGEVIGREEGNKPID